MNIKYKRKKKKILTRLSERMKKRNENEKLFEYKRGKSEM